MAEFSLVTVNTFGVPMFLAWERLGRLASELNRLAPSIICTQEIQQNAYIPRMKRSLASYPYVVHEKHWYAPMGGLMTFSRLPLSATSGFTPFLDRGRLLSIGWSDWTLHKGVLVARAEIGNQPIAVLNAHLQANYSANFDPRSLFGRIQLAQARHLAEVVRAQPAEAIVVACGDFNFPRDTEMYRALTQEGGLTDPLAGDRRPTYRPFPLVPSKWNTVLDFVLVRVPQLSGWQVEADVIPLADTSARWALRRFLTDHCALALRLRWDD